MATNNDNLIRDLDEFRDIYHSSSWWKRTFSRSRFQREFDAVIEKNQTQDEMVLRILATAGRIGLWNDPGNYPRFLEAFMDKELVDLFSFLYLVVDEKQHTDNCFGPINSIFDTLSKKNRVSCGPQCDNKPLWSHPDIPCLLESLIQLISGEKTKYKVYNNHWHNNSMCWQTAAEHAKKLVDFAIENLKSNALYTGIEVDGVAAFVKHRAQLVHNVSDEDAKKLPNYREINGDQGGFKPMPGHCQVLMAAASKQVNFVEELRILMKESGANAIFKRFVRL